MALKVDKKFSYLTDLTDHNEELGFYKKLTSKIGGIFKKKTRDTSYRKHVSDIISSPPRLYILWRICEGSKSVGEIKKSIPESESLISKRYFKKLEDDGLITLDENGYAPTEMGQKVNKVLRNISEASDKVKF
ncbi:MAG: hypothetical protein V1818_04625 [Candidatus Aenigmatarchaeota archaeon]